MQKTCHASKLFIITTTICIAISLVFHAIDYAFENEHTADSKMPNELEITVKPPQKSPQKSDELPNMLFKQHPQFEISTLPKSTTTTPSTEVTLPSKPKQKTEVRCNAKSCHNARPASHLKGMIEARKRKKWLEEVAKNETEKVKPKKSIAPWAGLKTSETTETEIASQQLLKTTPTSTITKRSVEEPEPRTKVLIVTEYRSGSSFVAEIFNRNPKAWYLFEPLTMTNWREPNIDYASQNEIIEKFLHKCKMPDPRYYFNLPATKNMTHQSQTLKDLCMMKHVCFKSDHHQFKEPPFCLVKNSKYCDLKAVNLTIANQSCQEKTIRASKIIKMTNLKQLESLKFDDNMHVIYLVRDPRGMVCSRGGFPTEDDRMLTYTQRMYNYVPGVCDRYKSNLEYLRSAGADWLKNKLLFLRYEDFCYNPVEYTTRIFEKFGIDNTYLDDVVKTIEQMSSKSKNSRKRGTAKNSAKIAH